MYYKTNSKRKKKTKNNWTGDGTLEVHTTLNNSAQEFGKPRDLKNLYLTCGASQACMQEQLLDPSAPHHFRQTIQLFGGPNSVG